MDNSEILKTLGKIKEFFNDDMVTSLAHTGYGYLRKDHIEDAIIKTEIAQEFGIPVSELGGHVPWFIVHTCDGFVGARYVGTPEAISWEDESKELEGDERLYIISFSNGAYCLHRDYPDKTFNQMFAELKSFGAKYCDTANNKLYFTKDVAKIVHESCGGIYKKYAEQVGQDLEMKRIERLEAELKKLKEGV